MQMFHHGAEDEKLSVTGDHRNHFSLVLYRNVSTEVAIVGRPRGVLLLRRCFRGSCTVRNWCFSSIPCPSLSPSPSPPPSHSLSSDDIGEDRSEILDNSSQPFTFDLSNWLGCSPLFTPWWSLNSRRPGPSAALPWCEQRRNSLYLSG